MPEAAPSRKRQIVRKSHKAILKTFAERTLRGGAPQVTAAPDLAATIEHGPEHGARRRDI